jgi:hypothetical protein
MRVELTVAQREFLEAFGRCELASSFYLSGGTALSAFHLHHRASDDLGLLSRLPFDPKKLVRLVAGLSEAPPLPRRLDQRFGFVLRLRGEPLRVELVHHDYDNLDPPRSEAQGVRVDGVRDILANKLSAMIERTAPKDYADVLFLLRRPGASLLPAVHDCERKFGWPGIEYLLQPAFLRCNQLTHWPLTEPVVTLPEAQAFYRQLAEQLVRLPEE